MRCSLAPILFTMCGGLCSCKGVRTKMTRLFKSVVLAGTVGMGLLSLGVTPVRADIVPVLGVGDDAPSPSPSAGGFTWTYDAILHSEQKVQTGDFFTIYDFFGYTGVHSEPAGWSLTAAY